MRKPDVLGAAAHAALTAAANRRLVRVDEPDGRHTWTTGAATLTAVTDALLHEQLLTVRYSSTIDVVAVPTPAGEHALTQANRTHIRPTTTKDQT